MIKVNNLTKTFQNGETLLCALNNVSFSINYGDFVVILGASGSGKSTLLNVLSGLERADNGSIQYDNMDIVKMSDNELLKFRRKNVGFVFQSYYLLPFLNVEANIKMGANLSKLHNFSPIIHALGLQGKEKKHPYELSGGEQQRVSIARALAKQPHFLFCDEPTGALDETTGKQIMKYLLELQQTSKITLILVTHNSNFEKLADKVIQMNSGNIVSIKDNSCPANIEEIEW